MTRAPIGLRVRERRKSLGITQTDLAARLDISVSYVNLIEHNKRNIGGRLLNQIARELQVSNDWLEGATERRLLSDLQEISTSALLANLKLSPQDANDFVGQYPTWARAMVTLHRAYRDRAQAVTALSNRLANDPFLSDVVHRMLTNIAALRSTSEILESVDDLEAAQQHRFHEILLEESSRLSDVASELADFFGQDHKETHSLTPAAEVDDFLVEKRSFFADLETAARDLSQKFGFASHPSEREMVEVLEEQFGVTVARHQTLSKSFSLQANGGYGYRHHAHYDADSKHLEILDTAPTPSRRFTLARLLARLLCQDVVEQEVGLAAGLTSNEAREKAKGALYSYCAGALLLPYDAFLEDAQRVRYDIDVLRRKYAGSMEQICHRLVTLRKPQAEGVPFAFMRADPSGFLTKRFPLPGLALPRQGGGCPLWAIYRAFQNSGDYARQLAEFPNGDQFLMIAKTVTKVETTFDKPRHQLAIMLACDALHADQVIYGDGMDFSSRAPAEEVGPACRFCLRDSCAYRQEEPVIHG
ncbi:helix-turn-helix domain-containing protein [Rhodovibrionaceae bacterium A322]